MSATLDQQRARLRRLELLLAGEESDGGSQFLSCFVGALSAVTADAVWDGCLETAGEIMAEHFPEEDVDQEVFVIPPSGVALSIVERCP
jgi:hypothetical protein